MRQRIIVATAALTLVAACGGTAEPTSTTATTTPPPAATTTTTLPPTTTAPSTTTTTTVPPTTTTVPPTTTTTEPLPYSSAAQGEMPAPLDGSDGWFGSGCSPGSDDLPDGIWFGYVRSATPWDVTIDLACLRWVPDPNDDGFEEAFWEFANVLPKERTVPVDPTAAVTCPWAACPEDPATYQQWLQRVDEFFDGHPEATEWTPDQQDPTLGLEVWLFVNDGEVTEIVEPVIAG